MLKNPIIFATFKRSKTYFLEAAALFLVLLAIDYLFMQNQSLNQIFPHPFWIPVVLLSAQYGSSGGVIAAIIALLLYLVLGLPQQGVDQDYYDYLIDLWKQPALWTLTAIILGEIGTRHINERIYLNEEMVMFKKQRQTIADYCTQLEQNIEGLERQIATIDERSSRQIFTQLAALSALESDQIEAELPVLLEQIFGPLEFGLHHLGAGGSGSLLVDEHGAGPLDEIPRGKPVSLELRQWLEGNKTTFSVLSGSAPKSLADQCLFAEPLTRPDSGDLIGVLMIHQLTTGAINDDTRILLHLTGLLLAPTLSSSSLLSGNEPLITRESA